MIEVTKASITRIHSSTTFSYDTREILVDSEACCPSIIGLKNPYETEFDECYYHCKECWEKALADIEDFKILWKYKGSDEYV